MRPEQLVPESKRVLKEFGDSSEEHRSHPKEALNVQISGNLSINITVVMHYYSVNKIGNCVTEVSK